MVGRDSGRAGRGPPHGGVGATAPDSISVTRRADSAASAVGCRAARVAATRACSAATASATRGGTASRRRDRGGQLRSGSGVIDSHEARLTMARTDTSTDHKVRMRIWRPWTDPQPPPDPRRCRGRSGAPAVHRSGAAGGRAGLIFERTWQLAGHVSRCPRPGSYITAQAGNQPVLVVRDEHHRLRAYRNVCRHRGLAAAERRGPVQGGDPLPLPRLDLPARRDPDRRPGGTRLRRQAGQDRARPAAGAASRRCAGWCSSTSTATRCRWPSSSAICRARLAPYRIETLESFAPVAGTQPANWKVVADNYLEGYHIPIAHPGLMRMLDYKRYDVEVHDHYVWFDAPLRDQAVEQPARAPLRPLVDADAGAERRGSARLALRVHLSRTRRSTCTPTRSTPGSCSPTGSAATRDVSASYRPAAPAPAPGSCSGPTSGSTRSCSTRTSTWSTTSSRACTTRGYRCGPLRRREAGVAWFADRIRATRAGATRRRDADRLSDGRRRPARGAASGRERILAAAVDAIAREGIDGVRIARIAMDAGVSRRWSTTTSTPARPCWRRRWSTPTPTPATRGLEGDVPAAATHAQRLAAIIDQCLPTTPALHEDWVLWVELWLRAVRHPELRPVAEELYARLHVWFAGRDRRRHPRRRVRALRSPTRSPTARWRCLTDSACAP